MRDFLIILPLLVVQAICILLFIRNRMVYLYQMKLISSAKELVRLDIALKMLREMQKVDYTDMVFIFWKPVRSFYSQELLNLLDPKNEKDIL